MYNFRIKGYLTAADLMKEVNHNNDSITNSETLKAGLFGKIFGEEGSALDADVKE